MPVTSAPIYVVQHTSGEFLGLIEDHLEGRGLRFTYFRRINGDSIQLLAAVNINGDSILFPAINYILSPFFLLAAAAG